jgi:hypothetical protein
LVGLVSGNEEWKRLLPLGKPVKNIGDELEVGLAEILHRDETRVAEGSHHLAEVSQFTKRHL